MQQTITKKQLIRSKVDSLLQDKAFITWDMIGICPYYIDKDLCVIYKYYSYEAKVVYKYMKKLGIDYVRYSDIYSDKKRHGNNRGFYYDIKKIRKRKIESIMRLNQN